MGIKGTVRRSVDTDFIHSNVDIDLVITEDVSAIEWPSKRICTQRLFPACIVPNRKHRKANGTLQHYGALLLGQKATTSIWR